MDTRGCVVVHPLVVRELSDIFPAEKKETQMFCICVRASPVAKEKAPMFRHNEFRYSEFRNSETF